MSSTQTQFELQNHRSSNQWAALSSHHTDQPKTMHPAPPNPSMHCWQFREDCPVLRSVITLVKRPCQTSWIQSCSWCHASSTNYGPRHSNLSIGCHAASVP
mmetsp:Transcript_39268/g.77740  ORF Transcript_39268/g.77740 Transcript_39268/m.77740 type:complete len:101 (+) Transcript_39268:267-569(+)